MMAIFYYVIKGIMLNVERSQMVLLLKESKNVISEIEIEFN